MSTVGERILSVRRKKCMKQETFGKALEVSQAHVSAIEAGKESPSKPLLLLMSYVFCVNFQWLLDGSGYMDDVWKTPGCESPAEKPLQESISITINITQENIGALAKKLAQLIKEIEEEVT